MLYHQVIDIGAYILFLDDKPIEPKIAEIVLTGTEDKLVGAGFHIQFRLRDLLQHISNILKRSPQISEEMVDWFLENLPITRTIACSFELNKEVFKEIEPAYYNCETIDQFLKVKPDNTAIISPLLNLDLYELVGMELATEDESAVGPDELALGFSGSSNVKQESMTTVVGVGIKMAAVQVGSILKSALLDLFSERR